ncbi:MAG: PLDc N-terminal domain-containing protein [Gemmatimonadaceae bacterium]
MDTGLFLENSFTWFGLVALILDVTALASIFRSRLHSRKAKVIWIAMVVLLPIFGAIAWLSLGREPRRPG